MEAVDQALGYIGSPCPVRVGLRSQATKTALLALTLFAALPCAAQFAVTARQHTVAIEGHLQALDSVAGTLQQADFADARSDEPLRVGMSLVLAEGLADAQGRASLDLATLGSALSFAALADVDTAGRGDGTLALSGSGHASVALDLSFTLAAEQDVRLSMASSVTRERNDDFVFLLARGDGTPLWRETTQIDAAGAPTRDFQRTLHLAAGTYRVVASLDAASLFDEAQGLSGRTAASVSLSLVPEPASAALLLAGLAAFALRRRR
jgi:hypothetical protein